MSPAQALVVAAVVLVVAALLWLAASCLAQAEHASGQAATRYHAAAIALATVALWWPSRLGPGISIAARSGLVPEALAGLAPLALALLAWLSIKTWQLKPRARAAAPALASIAVAWLMLEADPPGTPAVPGLMPALLALPLAAAVTLALGLQGSGRTHRALRAGMAFISAATLGLGAWRASAGHYASAVDSGDWMPLLALLGIGSLLVEALGRARVGTEAQPASGRLRPTRVDGLTGLPLRARFEARLARAVRHCQAGHSALAVLHINLDAFKSVNDAHGFQVGDVVLEKVARRLRRIARNNDTAARISGNDFLMLLADLATPQDVDGPAARLLEALTQPYKIDGIEIKVTCSVGVATWPGVQRPTRLIACAELAMREARRHGGARHCVYTPAIDGSGPQEGELLAELRNAIATHALELHFQPKVDAHSGKVTAAEALLRWRHPVRGMIAPDEFIPLAERSGLIVPLGDWVIEEACRQSRAWRDAGLRMRVAINLSAIQMQQEDIVDRISRTLERYRVHPSLLTCEITETAAMQDTRMTQETFRQLGRIGVHVSIDDFGTGYSSLAYLRKLPAEELKIDRAFITDIAHSEDARAVVDAVVRLAHALSLKVVAEGVETPQQQEILVQLGCDELQGYLFARPMTARALLLWAINDRADPKAFRGSLFANTKDGTGVSAPPAPQPAGHEFAPTLPDPALREPLF